MIQNKTSTSVLLSTAYLPPIAYVMAFLNHKQAYLEAEEHYVKQTYRNRCLIASVDGVKALIIPVSKTTSNHCLIRDVRIDYTQSWQRGHWKTLETAYNTSPFFLYYRDYLEPFYTKQNPFLLDFNTRLLEVLCGLLKIDQRFQLTGDYRAEYASDCLDLRYDLHPKKPVPDALIKEIPSYSQVFMDKTGFLPNLSIIDLLFNKGNQSLDYLRQEKG